jgi:hypothetical protein
MEHDQIYSEGRSEEAQLLSFRLTVSEHAGGVDGSLIPLEVVFAAPPLLSGYVAVAEDIVALP